MRSESAAQIEHERVFDVGLNTPLPISQFFLLGMQNVFSMIGMFVFPGVLGRAFDLPPDQIAYVYGMTFVACGVTTLLQSFWLLRLPIAQGPYAGNFSALLVIGHLQGSNLGIAYGSFFAAALIWCVLTLPIKGRSVIGSFSNHVRLPIISGMIIMLIMLQIASVALPAWIGPRNSPGFPGINLLSGAVAVTAIIASMLWLGRRLRRVAILVGMAAGTLCYMAFRPISFAAVLDAPFLVAPALFPFGFGVRADFVIVFLLALLPAALGSTALYQTVADWGGETLSTSRMSEGLFGMALGAVAAALLGGFGTIAYPENVAILRATRVGSRYATLAAGIFLISLGACIKFDMLLVMVPLPVISAAATLLFGMIFMHGVQILAQVEWNDRRLICSGLAFLVGLGGLFVSPEVAHTMPLMLQLILQQPVISGGVTLLLLHSILCRGNAPAPSRQPASRPA